MQPHKQPRSCIPAESRMTCWNQDYCSFRVSAWSDASSHHHTSWLWCSNPHHLFQAPKRELLSYTTTCFSCPSGMLPNPTPSVPRCPALTSAPCSPACHVQGNPLQPVSHLVNFVAFNSSSGSRHQCPTWPSPMRIRYSKHCQLSQCCVPVWFHAAVLSPTVLYPCCLVSFLQCLSTKATLEASKKQSVLAAAEWAPLVLPVPVQQDFKPRKRSIWISEVKESKNLIKLCTSYPKLVMDVPVRLRITQALLFH